MARTVQERMAIVDEILSRGGLVLTDPLMRNSLKNKTFGDACTGYTFRLNNLSYRGVWVSTIERLELCVDGETVPQEDMILKIDRFSCPVSQLANNCDVFWACDDECWLIVNKVGGLSRGKHIFELTLAKRNDFGHSYGNGDDLEGYKRDATELQRPTVIKDKLEYQI